MDIKSTFERNMQMFRLRQRTARKEIWGYGSKLFSFEGNQLLVDINYHENTVAFNKMTGCHISKEFFLNILETDPDMLMAIINYIPAFHDQAPLLVKKERTMAYTYRGKTKHFGYNSAEFSFGELFLLYTALKGYVSMDSFLYGTPVYTSEFEELEVLNY